MLLNIISHLIEVQLSISVELRRVDRTQQQLGRSAAGSLTERVVAGGRLLYRKVN